MFSVFTFIFVIIFEANCVFCMSSSEEITYYNNGWRPMSNEQVRGDLRRNFIKTPEIVEISTSWNPIMRPTESVGYFEHNSNIKPQDINFELMNESNNYEGFEMKEKQNLKDVPDKRLSNEHITNSEVDKRDKLRNTHLRKPKKILDLSLDNSFHNNENIKDTTNIKTVQENFNDRNITHNESNTYEVTEASEALEVKDLLEKNGNKNRAPFFEPALKLTTEENLTNKLFNILGNYNIRTNDNLTNYAASRRKYNSNSHASYIYPISRYNSQNHFPVNPLFAVFLSNYGHYLPGLYGFPGNYYNIYGYLASNNIHNNKPFGAYKIYSDTDSSH